MAYTFRPYGQGATDRRALGFVIGERLNAASFFDGLTGAAERDFRSRFDMWLANQQAHKKYFHGWDVPEFRDCFEFKRQDDRLFGFKCHPHPADRRLLLCALAYHDTKEGEEADKTVLRRINRLRDDAEVMQAIGRFYGAK